MLTDGKPTIILQRLRALNQDSCDDKIIQSVFLDQLPPQHRAILASSTYSDLDKLAEAADKIAEISSGVDSQINAVSSQSSFETTLKHLEKKHDSLTKRLDNIERPSNESSRPQSRGRSRRDCSSSRDPSGLCLAHRKYPNNPRSCPEWCFKYGEWQQQHLQQKKLTNRRLRRCLQKALVYTNVFMCVIAFWLRRSLLTLVQIFRSFQPILRHAASPAPSLINTYGESMLTLNLGIRRPIRRHSIFLHIHLWNMPLNKD